jgi:hypothetical protein
MSEQQLQDLERRMDFLQDRMVEASSLIERVCAHNDAQDTLIKEMLADYVHADNNIRQSVTFLDEQLDDVREILERR